MGSSSRPASSGPLSRIAALPPPRPSSRTAERPASGRSNASSSPRTIDARPSGLVAPAPASNSAAGLLPSFAHGRFLPPPHPALARESSDPRSYLSSPSSSGWASLRSPASNASLGPSNGGQTRFVARAPSPARPTGLGAKSQLQPRRATSPGPDSVRWAVPSSRHSSQPSAHPPPSGTNSRVARPPSPLHRAKSYHPSYTPSHHAPNGHARPPAIVVNDARPSLRRTHSKVELESPTTASLPPSPAASAHFSPAERHRTVRSNEQGYRSLVRRASLTTFDLRVHDDDEVEELAGAHSPPPPPAGSHYSYAQGPAPPPHLPDFPPDDPRIPPTMHQRLAQDDGKNGASSKRTIFTPYELSILQALWSSGRFYPTPPEVDEVQRRTGLSRVQVRNWFANKRQRASGEEKERVVAMSAGLAVAF